MAKGVNMANGSNLTEEKAVPDYVGHRKRLKERFTADFGQTMPDYELLELALTYALPRRDVKPIAKSLLRQFSSLSGMIAAPIADLQRVDGVGYNVVTLLKMMQAFSNRLCWARLASKDATVLDNIFWVIEYCRSCIGHSPYEHLLIIYLNVHNCVIGKKIIAEGTIDEVAMQPRKIVEDALEHKAASIIMVHNHPGGKCEPSKADIDRTVAVKAALNAVSIELIDHLIITANSSYSMKNDKKRAVF